MGEKLVTCSIPDKIGAGLTFSQLLTLTAYPAPDWSVSLVMRGPAAINLQATAEGSQHRLHATAAETSAWSAGMYRYALRATNGTDVVEVDSGQIAVEQDLAAVTDPIDSRSQAQVALEAIEAVLANRATLDQERYRINNRELYRTPIADLLKLRAFYAEQVKREKAAGCGRNPFGATVRVRLR